jgi:hypothetical protein
MMNAEQLQLRAQRALAELERKRRDPRYRRVLGRMVGVGLLTTNEDIPKNRALLAVSDVLWAGDVEPRILELLPALLVRRPALFVDDDRAFPDDLVEAVSALRRNAVPADFRGVPGATLHRWLGIVGRGNKLPSRLKAFRLQTEDIALLTRLRDELGISETAVLRRGLRALANTTWLRREES